MEIELTVEQGDVTLPPDDDEPQDEPEGADDD
jgi:hypothetical protein